MKYAKTVEHLVENVQAGVENWNLLDHWVDKNWFMPKQNFYYRNLELYLEYQMLSLPCHVELL